MARYDLRKIGFIPNEDVGFSFIWLDTPEGYKFWQEASRGELSIQDMLRAAATWGEMKRRYERGEMVYEWEYKP